MTDAVDDGLRFSFRINIPTVVSILTAAVTGAMAWAQTEEKVQTHDKRLVSIEQQALGSTQTLVRVDTTVANMADDLKDIKESIRELHQERRGR